MSAVPGPYVFNIQRFSTHDGPGLRTTVFFKGCPLRCPWCHNPESVRFEPETMTSLDGRTELVGRFYPVEELVAEVAGDTLFFDHSGGGVTLSGGEVMVQDGAYVTELVTRLAARGISVGIDTSGLAATGRFRRLAPLVDFFLYDLKFIRDDDHTRWTGASNRLILKNLEVLAGLGATLYLRLILLEGLNTDEDIIEETMLWLKSHAVRLAEVNLLPYHRFGLDKQAKLGWTPQEFTPPADATLARVKAQVERYYDKVTVGG
jgi:pyruvate formate lyase activating enzyme